MYHVPVLLKEAIDGLRIKAGGTYADATLGGGGHSNEILKGLGAGKLVVFDKDENALKNAPRGANVIVLQSDFGNIKEQLETNGIGGVDGVLADLGVSSHQFDEAERGFSFRNPGPLDMRMNRNEKLMAAEIVNDWDERELRTLFFKYGELSNGGKIAGMIVRMRKEKKIETTEQLMGLLAPLAPFRKENQFFARVFQALRIVVNHELESLEKFLLSLPEILNPGGRAVIISYHSLEDRMVKNFFRTGNLDGEIRKDFFVNKITPLTEITRKPIVPDDIEMEQNSRSRSAKLRIAEKPPQLNE